MRLRYLPDLETFVFMDELSIIAIAGIAYWECREQATNAARNHGLGVHPSGYVFTRN